MSKKFYGTGVALATPFNSDFSIDYEGLKRLVKHVTKGGVDYLVVMGTTGEAPTLDEAEKIDVLKFIKEHNVNGLPIVYGMGGNNTSRLINEMDAFSEEVDAFLSANPYYNKPSQSGLVKHYEALADRADKPIILYNVPGRTASNISAETTIHLSHHPNIIGTKEASGSIEQCTEIAGGAEDGFLLISGDDILTIPLMSIGAVGVISVIANALPDQFSKMVQHARKQDYTNAAEIAQKMILVNRLMTREGNPTGVKGALHVLGICEKYVRLPLTEATSELIEEITEIFAA